MKDDFDQEVNQGQEIPNSPEGEQNQESENHNELDTAEKQAAAAETSTGELKIEDIIKPGRYGVSNSQIIPALKKAIAEKSIENVFVNLKLSHALIRK